MNATEVFEAMLKTHPDTIQNVAGRKTTHELLCDQNRTYAKFGGGGPEQDDHDEIMRLRVAVGLSAQVLRLIANSQTAEKDAGLKQLASCTAESLERVVFERGK